MKICLVLHKYSVSIDDPCCYPLGYMYVSSYLKSLGHQVKTLNYNLWDYDLREEIKDQDVVGFTGFEEFRPYILRDEKICLEMGKETIVGGALATFGGIQEFHGTQIQGEIETCRIDDILLPDYEGFGIEEYHKRHPLRYMGVLASRGCPYSCTFCAQTCQFRMREPNSVFAEIDEYSMKYSPEMIVFNDNTFNINKPRFMKFCAGMKASKLRWCAAIRCQPFDDEMARTAKDSGCAYFVVGVESFIQEKLDRMNKKIKVRQIERTLDLLHKHGIDYHGNVLLGFENETTQDIQAELGSVPKGYKVFPAMVQPFIGTNNGFDRSITKREYSLLNSAFIKYTESRGKTCYRQLES